jgi:hypothetical protein
MLLQKVTVTFCLLFASLCLARPVALNVMVADEVAVQSQSSEIIERMFADRLPGVEFRRVIVQAQAPMIPHLFSDNEQVHAELKEKLSQILQPGDELTYLILDTHGATKKAKDASNPNDAGTTVLYHLGEISYDRGVNAEFADLFDAVKPYAAKNLTIIMNACSVFAGNKDKASRRAEAMLAYFGAPDGTIYGSTIPETDTFALTEYGSWRNFQPPRKTFLMMNSLGLMLGTVLATAVIQSHQGNPLAYFAGSMAAMEVIAYSRPLISKMSELLRWTNLGYLFQFHQGRLWKTEFMQKMKDVARSFALPEKPLASSSSADSDSDSAEISGLDRTALVPRCQAVFR